MAVTHLSFGENERIGGIEAEMGESLAYIGKARRHGFESTHPDPSHPDHVVSNRENISRELADLVVWIDLALSCGDLDAAAFKVRLREKAAQVPNWVHQPDTRLILARLARPETRPVWLDIWRPAEVRDSPGRAEAEAASAKA